MAFLFHHDEKEGGWTLKVRVLEAKDQYESTHSALVNVACGKKRLHTHSIRKTKLTKWDETLSFDFPETENAVVLDITISENKFIGHTDLYRGTLKYNLRDVPVGAVRTSIIGLHTIPLKKRMTKFYEKYSTDKIKKIPELIDKYGKMEDELFATMVKNYGPEPESSTCDLTLELTVIDNRPKDDASPETIPEMRVKKSFTWTGTKSEESPEKGANKNKNISEASFQWDSFAMGESEGTKANASSSRTNVSSDEAKTKTPKRKEKKKRKSFFSLFSSKSDADEKTRKGKSRVITIVFCDPRKSIRDANSSISRANRILQSLRRFCPTRKAVPVRVVVSTLDTIGTLKVRALLEYGKQFGISPASIATLSDALSIPADEQEDFLATRGISRRWLRMYDRDGLPLFAESTNLVETIAPSRKTTDDVKATDMLVYEYLMPFVPYIGFLAKSANRLFLSDPLENLIHRILLIRGLRSKNQRRGGEAGSGEEGVGSWERHLNKNVGPDDPPYYWFRETPEGGQTVYKDPTTLAVTADSESSKSDGKGDAAGEQILLPLGRIAAELCAYLIDASRGLGMEGTPLGDLDRRWMAENKLSAMLIALKRILSIVAALRRKEQERRRRSSSVDEERAARKVIRSNVRSLVEKAADFLLKKASLGFKGTAKKRMVEWFDACITFVDHVAAVSFERTTISDGVERLFVDTERGNDSSTGLHPSRPLRSLERARALIKLSTVRRMQNEKARTREDASRSSLSSGKSKSRSRRGRPAFPRNGENSDAYLEINLMADNVWMRLSRVPSECIFVRTRTGATCSEWLSYDLLCRVRAVGASILADGFNMARFGPTEFAAKHLNEFLDCEAGAYFSSSSRSEDAYRRDQSLWIVRQLKVKYAHKLTESTLFELSFDSATSTTTGEPFYDPDFLFDLHPKAKKALASAMLFHDNENGEESDHQIQPKDVVLRTKSLDLTGHGLLSFSNKKKDSLFNVLMVNISELSVANNRLRSVHLSGLAHLRVLNISNNNLGNRRYASLCDGTRLCLSACPKLNELILSHNSLTGRLFADSDRDDDGCLFVNDCEALSELDISHNAFDWDSETFLATMEQMRIRFPNLRKLRVFGNLDVDLTWDDRMDQIAKVKGFGDLSLDWGPVTSDAAVKFDRARLDFTEGMQRLQNVVRTINKRNAIWKWHARARLSARVVKRFWWRIFRSQVSRASQVATSSCASVDVVVEIDSRTAVKSERDGAISLASLGAMVGAELVVPKAESLRRSSQKFASAGPVVRRAISPGARRLLRTRLVEIDGERVRMSEEDVKRGSIRLPSSTLDAFASALCGGRPSKISLTFCDCIAKNLSSSQNAAKSIHSYLPRLARIVFAVSRHNRLNALRRSTQRLVRSARRVLRGGGSDVFACTTEWEMLRKDSTTERQENALLDIQRACKERFEVPEILWPESQRTMACVIARRVRVLLRPSETGGLARLAAQAAKDNAGHPTTTSDVDAFALAQNDVISQIEKLIGTRSIESFETETNRRASKIVQSSKSESVLKIKAILSNCDPKLGVFKFSKMSNPSRDNGDFTTVMTVTGSEYDEYVVSQRCHGMLAAFAERVHESWKIGAFRRWVGFAHQETLSALRQETRWLGVLARQSERRCHALHIELKETIERADAEIEELREASQLNNVGAGDWTRYTDSDGEAFYFSEIDGGQRLSEAEYEKYVVRAHGGNVPVSVKAP
eukprot:g3078.t1